MAKAALLFASLAVFALSAGAATAQYWGSPGYYDGGYPQPRRYYQERYYGEPRYYGRGNPEIYINRYGEPACRRRGFTIQDGFCKPYRGF